MNKSIVGTSVSHFNVSSVHAAEIRSKGGGGGGIICLIKLYPMLLLCPSPLPCSLPAMALQFSRRCGENVAVKDGGLVVEHRNDKLVNSIECSNSLTFVTCIMVPSYWFTIVPKIAG